MPSCDDIRDELIECIQKTKCRMEYRLPINECFKEENQHLINEECIALKKAFSECKRSLLNMKYRFRGPKTTHT